jgi:hypothetical protein
LANTEDLETLSYCDHPSAVSLNTPQEKNAEQFFLALLKFLDEREHIGLKIVKLINLDVKTVGLYQQMLQQHITRISTSQTLILGISLSRSDVK